MDDQQARDRAQAARIERSPTLRAWRVRPMVAAFAAGACAAFTDSGRVAGEANDCTVRALTNVTRLSYAEAHADVARLDGRKPGKGCWPVNAYALHGAVRTYVSGKPTLQTWLRTAPKGFLIVDVSRHVFALVDGMMIDTGVVGPRTRVLSYWAFPDPTNGH